MQQPPFPNMTPPSYARSCAPFSSSSADPARDAQNWKIQWEHEIVRDAHGNVLRDRMVQKSVYDPLHQQSWWQQPSRNWSGKRRWLFLLVLLVPVCCPLSLCGLLFLSVVLSAVSKVILYLLIPSLFVAVGVFVYRRRRHGRRRHRWF